MVTFGKWLMREQTRKTRLVVFDFDGTVANVPERPAPGVDWRAWNGKDWWGSRASLVSPEEGGFYEGGVNQEVVDAFHEAENDPNSRVILLTGRRSVSAQHVRRILRANGLHGRRVIDPALPDVEKRFRQEVASGHDEISPEESHEQYFTGDHKVTNGIHGTFGHKKHVLDKVVAENGGFETIDIWDDRKDHIELFRSMGRDFLHRGLAKKFIIHQVFEPSVEGGIATVIHIPIK